MRMLSLLVFIGFSTAAFTQKLTTKFEQSGGSQTANYHEIIAWWKKIDAASPVVKMMEMGATDAGVPLHLVLISRDKDFDIRSVKAKKKSIILVLNGIHPGEPDGIDASMLLARDIAENKFPLPSNVMLAVIPVYNTGGALNRSKHYRADQNGPEELGFRGNAQNLDLNRDFIKCDSREALSFSRIFHYLDPDVFVDNHVSNGADYQHVMTLLTSQQNRLGAPMGDFLHLHFEPGIYKAMKEKGYDLVPYVNHFSHTPENGWTQFWDSPRYSSGYASLWNSFSFVPETHMLKPYTQRVASTRALMESFIEFTSAHSAKISELRSAAKKQQQAQEKFPIAWKLDRSRSTPILFKGYEGGNRASEVSGLPRLYYDRNKPFEKEIPFYNYYVDTLSVEKPLAYIIPQGWWRVIERLQANSVRMQRMARDTTIAVEWYRIESYQASQRKFEGHHPNAQVQVSTHRDSIRFRKGDYLVPMNQAANRFLVETLEPHAEDSYFSWNFFDAVLGQKEGFSDYHFEDLAAEYLQKNPELRQKLERRRSVDSAFARSASAQLNFVFQNSHWFEPAYLRYPVYRLVK